MHLDIYIDFKSPAAYLSLAPTLELVTETGVSHTWYPCSTRQRPVPQKATGETKPETHFRVRAEYRRQMHLKYAALQGTEMTFPDDPGSCERALAALLLVDDRTAYIRRAFKAYWIDGESLDEPSTVAALSGLSASEIDAALSSLAENQVRAQEQGVVDTPAYLIDGQIFIGREHMPWLRELLTR